MSTRPAGYCTPEELMAELGVPSEEQEELLRAMDQAGLIYPPRAVKRHDLLNKEDWERLIEHALDERDGKIAWERRNDEITGTMDEMREKYGL